MSNGFIELRGVNTHNKGAQLMMMAVAERFAAGPRLSVSPNGSEYAVRAQLGFGQTLVLNQSPLTSAKLGNIVPKGLRTSFGLVADKEIAGVLDAAGFAYSDAFGPQRSEREAKLARRWRKRGVPIVLLPQAFGPFTRTEQAKWSRELVNLADVVFARDQQSFDYVRSLSPRAHVMRSPDFTIGLKPRGVESPVAGDFGAVVPNSKMLTHTKMSESAYVDFLVNAALGISAEGLRPVVVVHEFNDRKLAERVALQTGADVFEHPNPLVLKRVLADAKVVVASRFHALVSALSSETPVVALGWSHKYEELLGDFSAGSWLTDGSDDVKSRISSVLADGSTSRRLKERVPHLLEQNELMWERVEDTLGIPRRSQDSRRTAAS